MRLIRTLPLVAMILLGGSSVPATGAKPAFTTSEDQDGTVYHIDFEQVHSPRDLTAIPGVKAAWSQHGAQLNGWLANARD
ncbi:MAG: hypothetical protein CMN03_01060, partial [Roseibacillus sp.]|nr:hypothetical protein [Roseibacillus sp.]